MDINGYACGVRADKRSVILCPDLESFAFVRESKHVEIPNLDKLIRRYEEGEPLYRIAQSINMSSVNSLRMAFAR